MWDHSFLISSVWLLLVEVGLEGDVGFLEGRAGACPLEGGPGFGSLVGRTVSKDMLRGGNKLRKSLGSLSADGWSCVLPS